MKFTHKDMEKGLYDICKKHEKRIKLLEGVIAHVYFSSTDDDTVSFTKNFVVNIPDEEELCLQDHSQEK